MGSVRAYIPSIEKPQDIIVMHKQTLPTAVSGIDALEHKIRLYKPENRLLFRGSTTKGHEVNEPHRHELYLLGDGESKVTWEIDTRMIVPLSRLVSTLTLLRRPKHRHLHLQQRGSHSWQPPDCSSAQVPLHRLCSLQGRASP